MKKIPEKTKAVLFDLDGTLVDSMWMWKDIDIEFLGRFGIALPDSLQKDVEGMSFSETAVYFKEQFEIPMTIPEIKACWNEMAMYRYRHEVALKPGIRRFLDWLKRKQIPMAIASSNSMELVRAVTDALRITEYFSAITVACQVDHGKPAPDIYLYAASLLETDPEHCLVFEDVPAGILAGKHAGMCVWAVEDENSARMREEKKALADAWIEDYREICLED